jgi:hypothetical protein
MNQFSKFLASTFLATAMLFTGTAEAMQIQQYDKMSIEDRGEYVADLIIGAQKVLRDEGRPDLAEKVHTLFNTRLGDDKNSVGMVEFEKNLARARLADVRNIEKNPKADRIEVEDAMAVTLEANGIKLPDSFFTVASGFQPKFPPQQSKDAAKKNAKKN